MLEAAEVGAGDFGIVGPGGHSHEAEEVEVRAGADGGDQFGEGFGGSAGFGFFLGEFDLEHDVAGESGLVEALGEFGGVDGLDDVEEFGGEAGFVGLEVADQVEACAGEILDEGVFGGEFLDVVFAEIAEAELVSVLNDGSGEDFGDGDEGDFGAGAAGAGEGAGEAFLDEFKALLEDGIGQIRF